MAEKRGGTGRRSQSYRPTIKQMRRLTWKKGGREEIRAEERMNNEGTDREYILEIVLRKKERKAMAKKSVLLCPS